MGVLVAVVLFLVSGTPSAATDFCALSMEEEAFKALKSGDKPNLTVSEGKDGKEIVWKEGWMGVCHSTCAGTLRDKGFDGKIVHGCFGFDTTTKLTVGY